MNKLVFFIALLVTQVSLAGDLGIFTDGKNQAGSNNIRVFATDSRLLITGYGLSWDYKKSNVASKVYVNSEGGRGTTELLGDDLVVWTENFGGNYSSRNLLKIKTCQ